MNIISGNKVSEVINKYMLEDGMDPVIDLDKSHVYGLLIQKIIKNIWIFFQCLHLCQ